MRVAPLASVILLFGCDSSGSTSGNPPGGGAGTAPDAGDPVGLVDAASADDAGSAAIGTGAIVFAAALDGQADPDVYVLDGGTITRLTQTPGAELYPSLSPDRTRIAFVRDFQLFTVNAVGRDERLVATKTGRERRASTGDVYSTTLGPAAWSNDGAQLAYPYPRDPILRTDPADMIDESYGTTLHIINVDGTSDHLVSADIRGTVNSIGWFGSKLSFAMGIGDCPDCTGGQTYGFIQPDGTAFSEYFFAWPSGNRSPNKHLDWSADGTRWAFVIGGNYTLYDAPGDIYVSTAEVDDARLLVSTASNPRWSPDGTQIAYIGSDGLYLIDASGGAPRRVVTATAVRGLDW
jgi:Tol biopolymer transport system component